MLGLMKMEPHGKRVWVVKLRGSLADLSVPIPLRVPDLEREGCSFSGVSGEGAGHGGAVADFRGRSESSKVALFLRSSQLKILSLYQGTVLWGSMS